MKYKRPMKILFYGAGVIGSLYASRLSKSGHEVTVLARGKRFQDLQEYGIVLQKITFARARETYPSVTPVTVVETLKPDDDYDIIVVPVRREQLPAIVPQLAAIKRTPNILIMVNNPLGYDDLRQALGERVCIGFPGAGGERDGFVIRYSLAPRILQPTTFGEIDGKITPRLKLISAIFREARFPVALSRNIDAWQKTHVAWVCPVADAIYLAEGSTFQLAGRRDLIHRMLCAIRENFSALKKLRIPITPIRIKIWLLPEFILTPFLMLLFRTRLAENIMAKHATNAKEEMGQLAAEFKMLANQAKKIIRRLR